MLVTKRAEILIKADPEQIWDFVNDPAHWMASNPEEHFGTEFFTPDKKVRTGGQFYQRESVAGIRADMRGHFLHVGRPENVSWTGWRSTDRSEGSSSFECRNQASSGWRDAKTE